MEEERHPRNLWKCPVRGTTSSLNAVTPREPKCLSATIARVNHHPPYCSSLLPYACGVGERAQFIWLFSLILVGFRQGTLPWSGSQSTSAASSVDGAIPACLGQVWVTLVMTLVPATVSSWSEVPVLWPFLFWTQAFSGLWPLSAPHLPYRNPWEHLNLPNMEHKLKGTCSASREALYCPNTCGSIY